MLIMTNGHNSLFWAVFYGKEPFCKAKKTRR